MGIKYSEKSVWLVLFLLSLIYMLCIVVSIISISCIDLGYNQIWSNTLTMGGCEWINVYIYYRLRNAVKSELDNSIQLLFISVGEILTNFSHFLK